MDNWNIFLTEWEELIKEVKIDIYSTNSGYWSIKIVEILKDLFTEDNFDDAISFILKFYEIESNSDYIDEIIEAKISCKGIVDFASEIQKTFLEYEEKLNELRNKIIKMDFHPFFKFLYSNQEINNNLMKNESCIELLYSSMQGLNPMAKDLRAQEEFGKLYSNQWHFFFELLQNAVDADSEEVLVKRKLIENELCLLFANKGKKFSPMDAWGIASINQGMKSSKNIGYFGIGFKSVQEICDSPIIISHPFQFRLNLGKRKREYYVEGNLSDAYSKIFSLEQLRYKNYFILDEIKKEEYSGFEEKVIDIIDPMFMMFLTPLKEIIFSFEGLEDKPLRVKRKSFGNGFEIINIDDNKEKFITNQYSKKFNIENKEFERQVQIAFKINEKSKKIIVEHKNSNLFSYFPLDNRNPGFNFVFHGQFSLTSSRQDINTANSLQQKLNYTLFEELGPKCFLDLFRFLSSSKNVILDEKLENLIPFEEKAMIIETDPKYLDIVIHNSFRKGLTKLLKNTSDQQIPFWWDQKKSCIPFSNVIFVDDSSANSNNLIIKFLKKHFNSQFKDEITRILQNSSIGIDPDKDIYICDDNFKKDFCKEVFDNEFHDRDFTSEKILDLIINILRSFESTFDTDYILKNNWTNYYFKSEPELVEFQALLLKWNYFEEEQTKARLFEHYLITLKDCDANIYYAKANFSNYYNFEENLQKAYPEIISVIRELKVWSERNSDYDLDLPLFIPEKYKENSNNFYLKANFYSIFKLKELLFIEVEENLNLLILGEEEIYRSFFKIIAKAIQRIEQKSKLHRNKFKLSELRKEYHLITGNPEFHGESNDRDEALIIRTVLQNFLELSIYRRTTSNEMLPLSELIWGYENYINLLSKSQFADSYNLLDLPFYNNFMKMQLFQENLVKLMNHLDIYDDNKEYYSRYLCNWFSNDTVTEALDILIKEHSSFILHKEPQDLLPLLLDLDTENQIVKILFSFLSSNEIYARFFEIFYSSIDNLPNTLIFLSDLTEPSLYQFYNNKGDELTIEVSEKLQSDLFIPINELYHTLYKKESNWLFRTDLNKLKNIGIKDVSIKKSISQLFINILDYLKSTEDHENWFKFYNLLKAYYSNLKEKSRTKFREDFKTNLKEFKILNEENELITLRLNYNNDDFFKSFEEFSYVIRKLIDLPYFESNKVHSDYCEIWDFLKSANLVHSPINSMKKEFMKKLLGEVFQESVNEDFFYSFLNDNFTEEEGENYIELYRKLLYLIKSAKLKLKDIKDFYIIPTMTMEFIKVKDIKQKYNILNNFNLEDFPREEILEKFEDFNWDYFDDWLHPGYFGSFKKDFKRDIDKKEDYNGKRFDEDFKRDNLSDDFTLDENSPFFLHLYLIDYYFRLKEFNFETDIEIISNSLKIFRINNYNTFLSKIDLNNMSKKDIQTIFSQAISCRKIFPVQEENSDKIYLTDLNSERITILSKKFKYPRVLIELSTEQKDIAYINEEIEKIVEKMPKEFNLSLTSYVFPLDKILENCQEIFYPEVKENLSISDHIQLIKYIFNFQNFNYYLQKDRKNLDQFLSSTRLKTLSNISTKIGDIYNPKLVDKVKKGLNDLIGSNFKSEDLQSANILDMNFYGLEETFINLSSDKKIFTNEISRKEAYTLVFNYINDNLQESENYREILKQIGGNLITFDKTLEFPEEKPLEILEDSIKQIIRFFIDKIKENKEIDFDKFFLNPNQEIYRDLLSEDLIITIDHRNIDLLDNFAEYIEVDEDSKYSFFKELMPFKEIEDYSFDILISQIQEKDSKRIIKALDLLFEEYADSLEPQKETEEYEKIKKELSWIQIDGEDYCLKSLFLKNSGLEISSNELKSIMKGYAFFDDFDMDSQPYYYFIKFFDIREISDENLIDHLEDLSRLERNERNNIRKLLIFLIEKDILKNNINRIEKIHFVEAVELTNNNSKKITSLEYLRNNITFFSNKKLIIDNLINEWSKASEFQGKEIYLLFDEDLSWNPKWEYIIEQILIALEFETLYGLDEFPIPDSIEESDMSLVNNPYEQQTKILRAILEFLKTNSKDGFPTLNLKDATLDLLEMPIKFYEITNPKGNITIKTIDNYDFTLSNVNLIKLFKLEEEEEVLNVYISNDHRSSDRKKYYFRELFDKIFINERNNKKSYKQFNEIVEWVWMDSSDLKNCSTNPEIIKEYLIDKNVSLRWVSKEKKDETESVTVSEISEGLVQEQDEREDLVKDAPTIEESTKQQEFVENVDISEDVSSTEKLVTEKGDGGDLTEPDLVSLETKTKGNAGQNQTKVKTPVSNSGGALGYSGFITGEEEVYFEEQDFDPECKPDEVPITEIQIGDLESEELCDTTTPDNYDLIEKSTIEEGSHELPSEEDEVHIESSNDYNSKRIEFTPELEPSETPVKEMGYEQSKKKRKYPKITKIFIPSHKSRTPPINTTDIGRWGEEYALFCLKDKKLKEYELDEDSVIETNQGFIIEIEGKEVFKAVWVNKIKESHSGFDIYFLENGEYFFIEVKATTTDTINYFDITRHEWSNLIQKNDHYYIYRVYNAGKSNARYLSIKNPCDLWKKGIIYVVASQIYLNGF